MEKALPQEDAHLKGALLWKMGKAYTALKRVDEAVDSFRHAVQMLRGSATPIEVVTVLEDFEKTYRAAGLHDKAAEVHMDLDAILRDAQKSTDSGTLLELAAYYISHQTLDDAQAVLEKMSTLLTQRQVGGSTNNKEVRDFGISYRRLGAAYEREEMYDNALTCYQKAAQLLESEVGSQGSQTYGVIMHDIGDVYRSKGQFDQALSYYKKAAEFKTNPRDLIATLEVIADVYSELNDYGQAVSAYKQALDKLESL